MKLTIFIENVKYMTTTSFFFPVWSELFYECWNSSAWWVNSRKSPEYVQLKCLYLQLKAVKSSWSCSHVADESRHTDGISMWCLNDSTVGWLRNSGGSKFQVTMVLGRNEYFYASTLVLICRMLWAQNPLVLVVLIWMYWWSGTSTRLFRISDLLILH